MGLFSFIGAAASTIFGGEAKTEAAVAQARLDEARLAQQRAELQLAAQRAAAAKPAIPTWALVGGIVALGVGLVLAFRGRG